MGDPRPTNPDLTAEQQAALLRETGNGPTVSDEESILHAEFGAPDERGVYGALAPQGGAA
jgi:hypothetical protein